MPNGPTTILIRLDDRGLYATAPELTEEVRGTTIGQVLQNALDTLKRNLNDAQTRIKIWPGMRLDTPEILDLLRTMSVNRFEGPEAFWGAPTFLLDMSGFPFQGMDFSPETLARVATPAERASSFNTGIGLSRAVLQKAQFSAAKLQSSSFHLADLRGAQFASADLHGADLFRADLRGAELTYCRLDGAFLMGANFENARLTGAVMQDCASDGIRLGRANLSGADLRDLDLAGAATLEGIRWHNARLEKTRFYRHQIKPIWEETDAVRGAVESRRGRGRAYDDAREAFLQLKTNFVSWGNYEDAGWAYVKERQMEKASRFPTSSGRQMIAAVLVRKRRGRSQKWWKRVAQAAYDGLLISWLHFRLFFGIVSQRRKIKMDGELDRLGWVRNWMYELLTGYGERPWNTLIAGFLLVIGFAQAYWWTGAVSEPGPRLPEVSAWSSPGSLDWIGLFDALIYSLASFATFNLARSDLNPEGRAVEIASSLEALLGIGIAALFVYALGNRMSRS